ncbi:MAG: Fluoride ion transporter CrcB [Cytophagales bacterium]|jgi:CrcB protein|nr:fluoride efflux transporter CrcB [Bacteroidota bacterium]MBS1981146.1 fluoride efflux transporter CrcB [Bacteroidota bacterium]WHZ06618.1 MAG: Fluoride ion transporter CrcB [Cytophagales bacterium]
MRYFFEIGIVFVGGGLGSMVRFVLGKWVNTLHTHHFPFGTLTVNIVACLIMGYVVGLADHRQIISASSRLFWTVGFCGGFSTFSTFSAETLSLIQNGFQLSTVIYVMLSLAFCLAATFGGIYLGENA